MQEEFKELVEETTFICQNYFVEELLSIYLHGSIAMNDAIPYVSDLDYHVVIHRVLSYEDEQYLHQIEKQLQHKYPIIDEVHISVHSVEDLVQDKFARFVLKYNSVLCLGKDIVKELEDNGCDIYEPNAEMAKRRLAFVKECLKQALNNEQPMCTGKIPTNTFYASRKFARYFVIIEGAYFLMSQNKFESFEKENVLSKLYDYAKGFDKELNMTREILQDPIKAGITHNEFLQRIHVFVEWMFDKIEKS